MIKAQGVNPLGLYSTRLRVYRIKNDDRKLASIKSIH